MKATKKQFDAVIIGGGAAGLSCALWCDELGLSTLLLEKEKEFGGQLLWTYNAIENHLGTIAQNGREMRDIFLRQIDKRNFTSYLQAEVKLVKAAEKIIELANGEQISAKAIIIATGVRRRKSGIAGEDFFKEKGIIESGKKDSDKVENKNVLIVGGGDAALENALILAEKAAKVYLVHRREKFRGRPEFVEKVGKNDKIKILTETELLEITGKQAIEAVKLKNRKTGETEIYRVEAILFRIGIEPNTEFFRGQIDLDENGYIKINSGCETNIRGIFAIGDAANPNAPTISNAVGMGAASAKNILAWLNR